MSEKGCSEDKPNEESAKSVNEPEHLIIPEVKTGEDIIEERRKRLAKLLKGSPDPTVLSDPTSDDEKDEVNTPHPLTPLPAPKEVTKEDIIAEYPEMKMLFDTQSSANKVDDAEIVDVKPTTKKLAYGMDALEVDDEPENEPQEQNSSTADDDLDKFMQEMQEQASKDISAIEGKLVTAERTKSSAIDNVFDDSRNEMFEKFDRDEENDDDKEEPSSFQYAIFLNIA